MIRALFTAALLSLAAALPARAIDIQQVTSPGGVPAWLVEDHSIPFVALNIAFRGGASVDAPGKRGAVNLMTALLEEGAGEQDATAYAEALESLGATTSFDAGDDAVTVSLRALTENRDEAADLLHDALTTPRFDADAVEEHVEIDADDMLMRGFIDRIDVAPTGEIRVVDYKTGRNPSTDDEARGSQALALYVLAVRRTLRRPCSRVELHHVPTGTVASFEHTERSLANHARRAEDVAIDIAAALQAVDDGQDPDAAFPAVPGRQCGWCDFRPACPTGQAATPAREPWSFLAEDDETPA